MSITYNICKVLRACTLKRRPKTSAVILLAGSGTRMQSDRTKQMMTLCERPMFIWSLLAFDRCEYIDEIVLVCKREEIPIIRGIISEYKTKRPIVLTEGGSTRQLSALAGFEKISPKSKFVAIHDSARACITSENIADVVAAAYAHGAASAVGPCVDTVKEIDDKGFLVKTLDRDRLVMAQTPQVFKCDLYRAGAYTALRDNVEVTDDNMLAERLGYRVRAVDCSRDNFKITTKNDIINAESILRSRGAND